MATERHKPGKAGFIYALYNPLFDPLKKIGRTELLPEDRASQLSRTALPEGYSVVYRRFVSRVHDVERRVHDLLSPYRYKKEFFCVTVEQARDAVEKAAIEVTGIESWRDGQVVHLRNRDKFVLALTAGEVLSISDIGPSTISCRTRPR